MTRAHELYACLYAEEFPAQALLRLRPELRGRPCVVLEGEPPLQQVCSLNRQARLLGMRRGMTRVEVDTFAEAVVLSRSLQEEAAAKAAVLEGAAGFSPRIEDRSEAAALLCGIDVAGTQSLFGPPEALLQRLLERVRALGFSARVTGSCNLHAAMCLARGLTGGKAAQLIPAGEEAAALAGLPLRVLDVAQEQAEIFVLWGIHNLGMLAGLPEKELIARLGQAGRRLQQLARGELPHLFQPAEPAFSLEERMELDCPIELLDSLLFVVSLMLDQLLVRARARLLAVASLTIGLQLEGGGTHSRTVRTALPTMDKQLWIKLLHLDMEAHPPQTAIVGVSLQGEPGDISKVQLGLFSPQLPEAARLDVTLARISAIVGEGNVGRAVLQDTHAAEGFQVEAFKVPAGEGEVKTALGSRACTRQLRPQEPAAITLEDGRPKVLVFRKGRYAIARAYGPWLVSGEWWNQTLWGAEQWDVVTRAEDGAMLCCCLVRDLLQNQWWVAALYD